MLGRPDEPKDRPVVVGLLSEISLANFGLTFEDNALRARTELTIEPAKAAK
jgi:hypothetical protein